MVELLHAIGLGLLVLLPLTNPLTSIALFLALSGGMSDQQRNHQALMASIYVFMIIVISFYCGKLVMNVFGISIPGLRIAGGMIVSFIGFRMLFPSVKPASANNASQLSSEEPISIAFVPIAIPSTAGPGTIAMIISAASTIKTGQINFSPYIIHISSILVPLLLSLILWIGLRSAGSIMRLVGQHGIDAISRIMGFLLVCMGVQFIINGVIELIKNYPLI